jgi:predicted O-methyltransferase YrrM
LAACLSQLNATACEVNGISPFSHVGDSVTRYSESVDYFEDTLANFKHFGLPHPKLLRAFSTDPSALAVITGRAWDLIYIDGNHDYDVVRLDWEACSRCVKPGGLVVLDDAGLGTKFHPPIGATGGHPGPSRLAQEIDPKIFVEILQVGHNRVFQKLGG